MWRRFALVLLAATAACGGSLKSRPPAPAVGAAAPSSAAGPSAKAPSSSAASVQAITPSALAGTATLPSVGIQVFEFGLGGAEVTNYDGPTSTYGLQVAEAIVAELRKKGLNAQAAARGSSRTGQLIVDGEITKIDGGSRAKRYLVSFGAGAARFAVIGKVARPNGDPVGEFADERWSGVGMFGGDAGELLLRSLGEIGSDVAEMVQTGKYEKK